MHPPSLAPRTLRQRLGFWALRLLGWTPVLAPPPGQKFVLVGYPHTSNWDFLFALLWGLASGTRFRWVGKKELFPPLLGWVMRGLGGIPVDRGRVGGDFVKQVARLFAGYDNLWVVVAAEGTRSRAAHWRTGFYYMALEAKVPIALAYLDRTTREVGVGGYLVPTGDLEADFERIRAFYQGKVGLRPERQSPIRLKLRTPGNDG
ncbi:glycerol acyltransferase [Meiothermus sp. QL-1]|uniref:lysophospholipid acyltransferase family protein n=1 Tax=Meiothermus sp. QL-1 TaxID=2058095 RepID=UPI000E0C829B|nr:lysophospholipid acyltransferase family protein [Meiothermus sp. QL-1]RDI94547.1 glycerol acyltransferase [Meiothermus sp. QL-1]